MAGGHGKPSDGPERTLDDLCAHAVVCWGLTPADFWRLSWKQFHAYDRAYSQRRVNDAEIANRLLAKAVAYLLSPYAGENTDPIDPFEIFPPLTEQQPARAIQPSQEDASKRLEAQESRNALAFESWLAVASIGKKRR